MEALRVDDVRKSFRGDLSLRRREVLRGVSLWAEAGEILGFLGPNGAGKTTTIKIILGLLRPDSGSATIFGAPAGGRDAARRIGYLPETPYFHPHLSLREFLEFCGVLSGLSGAGLRGRIGETIDLVGLGPHAGRRLRGFSKGMLQRAGLAQAILHDPDLLVLDEPFSGLDPLGRKTVRDILVDLKGRGRTIFFSSHILPDMEALCDRTAIIREGTVTRSVTLDEIYRLGEGRVEVTARGCAPGTAHDLADYVESAQCSGGETFLLVRRQEFVRTVIQHLYRSGAEVLEVTNHHPSLEEVFLDEFAIRPSPGGTDPAKSRAVGAGAEGRAS
ncbi:MAG: ABC transporter ATP-binding protein [Candidatus Krumholzibacteria bacterium]|nr:ABC transporter ATP-binding protein [Candidatus Krumholzibacteria bacterium]